MNMQFGRSFFERNKFEYLQGYSDNRIKLSPFIEL